MSDDVLITPASRKIEFKDSGGTVDAKIETDSSGNLVITNPGGDISIGDTTADVFIGDGVNSIDLVFEQDGEIRGTSGVTLTLGDSNTTLKTGTSLDIAGSGAFQMGGLNVITSARNMQNIGNINIGGYYAMDGTTLIDTSKNIINVNNITTGASLNLPANSSSIGIYAGSTQVFQGSTRNLVNIGTINSGAITSSGRLSLGTSSSPTYGLQISNPDTSQAGAVYVNAKLNSSGKGLVIDSNTRTSSEASTLALQTITRTNTDGLAVQVDGKVGIGTGSPAFNLHVLGSGSGDATFTGGILVENNGSAGEPAIAFKNSVTGSNYWLVGCNQDSELHFGYGTAFQDGNSRMTIKADGKVFIGAESGGAAQHKLDIYSNENVPLRIHRPSNANLNSSGAWGIGFSTRSDTNISSTDTRAGIFSYYNGNMFIATNTSSIVADPDASARLTVLSGGNIGIGTMTPAAKLDLRGDLLIVSTDSEQTASADSTTVPDATGTSSITIQHPSYTDGRYTTRIAKIDRSGGLPVYFQESLGTANSYTNVFRVGYHSQGDATTYRVQSFYPMKVNGHIGINNSSEYIRRHQDSWTNAPDHTVMWNGWYSTLNDYVTLKAAGNGTSGHGIILVADNGVYFGKTNTETGNPVAADSSTEPLDTNFGHIDATGIRMYGTVHDFLSNQSNVTFNVGRNGNEKIQLFVNDGDCTITADQDSDDNATHNFILDRQFDGTGANNFSIRKNNSNQFNLDTNAAATFYGNLYIPNAIYHSGDTDTYINFGTDIFQVSAGGDVRTIVNSESLQIEGGAGLRLLAGGRSDSPEGTYYNWFQTGAGTDTTTWWKICDVDIGTGLYKALALHIRLKSQFGNYGSTEQVHFSEYTALFPRSAGVQDDQGTPRLSGYDTDNHELRIYKTGTGAYELQARMKVNYRDLIAEIQVLSTNGGTVTMNQSLSAGTTSGGTAYTASQSHSTRATHMFQIGKFTDLLVGSSATNLDSSGRVQAGSAGTILKPSFSTVGDVDTGMYFPAAGEIGFTNNNSESVRIDSSGRVGIGTSTPVSVLNVHGGSCTYGTISTIYPLTVGNNGNSGIAIISSGTTNAGQIAFGDSGDNDIGRIRYDHNDNSFRFITNAQEQMRIDSSGNVGIGTSDPDRPLHIAGNPAMLLLEDTGGGTDDKRAQLQVDSGVFEINSRNDNNSSRVDNIFIADLGSGNIGIGTSSPAYNLVVSNGGASGIEFGPAYSGTANLIQHYNRSGAAYVDGVNDAAQHRFNIGGTEKMRIDSSGNVGIGTTDPDEFNIGNTYKYLAVGGDKPGIINLVDSGTNGSYLQFGTAAGLRRASVHAVNGSHLVFTLNSSNSGVGLSEAMRITNAGNVGIGEDDTGSINDARLVVRDGNYASNQDGGIIIQLGDATSNHWRAGFKIKSSSTGSPRTVIDTVNGTSGGFTEALSFASATGAATFASSVTLPLASPLYFGGGSHTYIQEDIDDRLRFYVGGAEFMRFTEDANDANDKINFYKKAHFTFTDSIANEAFDGMFIDHNISGSQATTGNDYVHRSIYVDTDSSATGGDTTDEHRVRGIEVNVRCTGDSDQIHGVYATAEGQHSSGTVSEVVGVYGVGIADEVTTGRNTTVYALRGIAYGYGAGTGSTTTFYGAYPKVHLTTSQDKNTGSIYGVRSEIETDDPGQAQTTSTIFGVRATWNDDSGGNVTASNSYLFYGNYDGTCNVSGSKYGVYINADVVNRFVGPVRSDDQFQISGSTVIDVNRTFRGAGIKHDNTGDTVIDLDNNTYTTINNPDGDEAIKIGGGGNTDLQTTYTNDLHRFYKADGTTTLAFFYTGVADFQSNTIYGGDIDVSGNSDANSFRINGTSIVNSSRVLQNITFGYGPTGARFQVGGWIDSTDGDDRFYFASDSHTYYKSGGSGGKHIWRNGSDVSRAELDASGNFIAEGNITAYGSASDIRIKENIEVIPDSVEKVKSLRGVTFNYKKDGKRSTGLVAQELQKVLPEAVYETKDSAEEGEDILAIRYGNVVGLLVEALKEQQTQIDNLTALVNELKEK